MPRLARLDAPGVLHHIMIRGIEGRCVGPRQQPKLICGPDQLVYFGYGEDIGEGVHFGGFDNVDPLPVLIEDMLPEELQSVSVNLDGAPGMGLNQVGEIGLSLSQGQKIGAAIEKGSDSTYGPGVGVNGLLGFALQLE